MGYKLIALDVDDTLLNDDMVLTPRTATALKRAAEKGILIVPTTGRLKWGIVSIQEELGILGPSISCGGALVYSAAYQELASCFLEPDDTQAILTLAHEIGIHAQVYGEDCFYYERDNPFAQAYHKAYGLPGQVVPDLYRHRIHTPKVLLSDTVERITSLQLLFLERLPHLTPLRSKRNFLEFTHPDASKGGALAALAERYGIPREDVMAVGDGQIDISMLRYAGLGVAVENALDEVKAIAQVVTASNNEDGVALAIEKYVLGEE